MPEAAITSDLALDDLLLARVAGSFDYRHFFLTSGISEPLRSFIAQVVPLADPGLEKLHIFGAWLKRLVPTREAPQGGDVTDDMLDLRALRLRASEVVDASLERDANKALTPIDRFGANSFIEADHTALSEIIDAFNTRHATNFTEEDYIRFEAVNEAIVGDHDWVDMLRNNPPGVVRPRFNEGFMRWAIQAFQRDRQMQSAFMQDREAREMLMDLMFQRAVRGHSIKLYNSFRSAGTHHITFLKGSKA